MQKVTFSVSKTYRDPNTKAHCAQVQIDDKLVEFFKLPYQPYYARSGNKSATLATIHGEKYNVIIREVLPDGCSSNPTQASFTDQDTAFLWAAEKLLNLTPKEQTK